MGPSAPAMEGSMRAAFSAAVARYHHPAGTPGRTPIPTAVTAAFSVATAPMGTLGRAAVPAMVVVLVAISDP